MLFIGDDWAEAHHDVEIEDDSGTVLVRRRLADGMAGITALHGFVAEHLDSAGEPDQVLVGIETERGHFYARDQLPFSDDRHRLSRYVVGVSAPPESDDVVSGSPWTIRFAIRFAHP